MGLNTSFPRQFENHSSIQRKKLPMADTLKGTKEVLSSLDLKEKELKRLIDTLHYYRWLQSQGLSWDIIQGIAPQTTTYSKLSMSERCHFPKEYRKGLGRETPLVNFKLTDQTVTYRRWPPFDDAVIYNRPYV